MSYEILRLEHITKSYGIKPVLNGIDLSLSEGQRVALVGENGAGKSTLARIIMGAEPADNGSIRYGNGATVGYLPQEVTGDDDTSVERYIEQATGNLAQIRDEMQQLEQRMAQSLDNDIMTNVLERYGILQEQYERRGGYDLPSRMEAIFAGLGIDYLDTQRALHTLSGGERTRVALAGLLLQEPDLLLLDEPTNHLDFAGIEWLENYLRDYPHALLLITHDRTFINRVANIISELSVVTRTLSTYHGTYDDYLAQREAEYQSKVDAYTAQQNHMKALQRQIKQIHHNSSTKGAFSDVGDKFLRNFKREAGQDRLGNKIREAKQELATIEESKLNNPRHEWRIEFRFEPEPLSSAEPIVLENLSKSFGDSVLFANANLRVQRGERVVLVAPNGRGKSTLLRILMGFMPANHGNYTVRGKVGFLDQDGETLNATNTVLQSMREVVQGSDSELLSMLHRSGLFSDATLGQKQVRDLSVGQRRKLGLARLIASKANVLLLDEPTNHLDPISLEALEEALMNFDGAILAVSHDRRFVKKVATRIWHIENHALVEA